MDAKRFLEEARRMCKAQEHCKTCLIKYGESSDCLFSTSTPECWEPEEIGRIVPIIEQWSAEHPRKTRLMDFREKYPDAPLLEGFNIPRCYPVSLGYCDYAGCLYCPNKGKGTVWCWEQEVQEDETD